MYSSLALSACQTSILLHFSLPLDILFLRSLGGQRPKIWILSCHLQLLFWPTCLGGYYSTLLFTSGFQFIDLSGLLVTGLAKLSPTRGRWRKIWMMLLSRLGEHTQVPNPQHHEGLELFSFAKDIWLRHRFWNEQIKVQSKLGLFLSQREWMIKYRTSQIETKSKLK